MDTHMPAHTHTNEEHGSCPKSDQSTKVPLKLQFASPVLIKSTRHTHTQTPYAHRSSGTAAGFLYSDVTWRGGGSDDAAGGGGWMWLFKYASLTRRPLKQRSQHTLLAVNSTISASFCHKLLFILHCRHGRGRNSFWKHFGKNKKSCCDLIKMSTWVEL